MQDARIIRHLGKLKSVPRNAQFILDVAHEKGSFGALIAEWPVTDIVGLWTYLKKTRASAGRVISTAILADGRQGHLRAELRRGGSAECAEDCRQGAYQFAGHGYGAGCVQPMARRERWAADEPDFDDAGLHSESLRPSRSLREQARSHIKPSSVSWNAVKCGSGLAREGVLSGDAGLAFTRQLAVQLKPPPHIQHCRAEHRQARAHLQ